MLATLLVASLLTVSPDAPVHSARLVPELSDTQAPRPRLWPPLLLTVGGIVLGLSGIGFIWAAAVVGYWYAFSFAVAAVAMMAVGIVFFAAAVPLMVIGAIQLHRARIARRALDEAPPVEDSALITLATF